MSTPTLTRRVGTLVVGLLAMLGAVVVATAAQAHDVLIASDPAGGAVLEESPDAIVLSFNNSPLDVGSVIAVVDADGTTLVEGEGTVEGTDVRLDLDAELPAGELEVRWRVASSDGHPIEGTIHFTVDVAPPPTTQAPEPTTQAPEPTTGPAAEPATEPALAEPAVAEASPEAATESASGLGGLPMWLRIAVAVAAVASVAGLIVIVVRRLRGDRM